MVNLNEPYPLYFEFTFTFLKRDCRPVLRAASGMQLATLICLYYVAWVNICHYRVAFYLSLYQNESSVQDLSNGNEFDLLDNKPARKTHF